jgi:molybdate transport system ATP-binding protein
MTGWDVAMADNHAYVRLVQPGPIPLDVEIRCNAGEIFVLVGPSGSGKTTTLRSIAGLYRPQTGKIICHDTIWFDSEVGTQVPVQKRAVGFVFQHYALFPHLNVADNISIAFTHCDAAERQGRLLELINMTHLTGLERRYPDQLSGGQQQRVAIARALARQPAILLLDEPFSAVDQQTRRHLVRELVQLKSRIKIPVIHVTHNLNEARRIADKLSIIDNGRTLQTDTPGNIMARPDSAAVARLTGHDNVFTCTVMEQDADKQFTRIKWHDRILLAGYQPEFRVGERADWMIPATRIVICDSATPAMADTNRIQGTIAELIQLGDGTLVNLTMPGISDLIDLNVSTHLAVEERLSVGKELTLSLPTAGLHLMKATL